MVYTNNYSSPLGGITLASDGESLTGLWFDGQKYFGDTLGGESECAELPIFEETKKWLDTYFTGRNPGFMPRVCFDSSQFRESVW